MDTQSIIYVILFIQISAIMCIIISFIFYKNMFLIRLIPKLPILTSLVTSTGIILTYLLFNNNYTKNVNDTTIQTTIHGFNDLFKIFSDNYKMCPKFIESLNFDFVKNKYYKYENVDYSGENMMTINYISNIIFQSMENYLVTAELTETSDSSMMGTFLSFLSSKQLQERWPYFKYNVGLQTRKLVDFLIKARKENRFKNAEEVNKFCDNLVFSKEFNNILHFKDQTIISFR